MDKLDRIINRMSGAQLLGLVAGLGTLGYLLVRRRKDLNDQKGSVESLKQINQTLNQGIRQNQALPYGQKDPQKLLTLPLNQYSQLATTLQVAMQGSGTNEEAIYRVVNQLSTNYDVLKLIEVFGMKTLRNLPIGSGQSLNLIGWLNEELNESEIKEVNKILRSRGITFQL